MKAAAVIVAAGGGARLGGTIPKQYRDLSGRPLIAWSLNALRGAGVDEIVVVIDPSHKAWFEQLPRADGIATVVGGPTRTASVRAGLAALKAPEAILIHDAARPGVTLEIVAQLKAALAGGMAGAAPALPLADALKRVGGDGQILEEAARAGVVRVQTPQAFRRDALLDAYARLPADAALDDDLAVVRAAGYATTTIPGSASLMKATYPEDWAVLEKLLGDAGAGVPCVGHGFDAHRFGDGDHVTLCGVRIAHMRGLIGHSDADAGWHALTDAILGALALGDIGDHFPPSDPQWRGRASEIFSRALQLAAERGARIVHVDVTLICERPKIAQHREAMRARTAEVLGLPLDRISIKATTTEKLGFLGREEGLAAQATATLLRYSRSSSAMPS